MNHTSKISFIHLPISKIMIIFLWSIFKDEIYNSDNLDKLSSRLQERYSSAVDNLSLNRTTCPSCKAKGDFEIKAYYYRNISYKNVIVRIRIQRVKCKSCHHSHAIFFEDFIPYYRLTSFESLQLFLNGYVTDEYDSYFMSRLKKRFNVFIMNTHSVICSIEKLHEFNLLLVPSLKRSYLQIHSGYVDSGYFSP